MSAFEGVLAGAFASSAAHVLSFDNAFGEDSASNTVYVAVKADLPVSKAIPPTSDQPA